MRRVRQLALYTCWAPWLRWNMCGIVVFNVLCCGREYVFGHLGSHSIFLQLIPILGFFISFNRPKLPLGHITIISIFVIRRRFRQRMFVAKPYGSNPLPTDIVPHLLFPLGGALMTQACRTTPVLGLTPAWGPVRTDMRST